MRGNQFIRTLAGDTRGATAIEYGLILALVVLAIMVSVQGVASETNGLWALVSEEVLAVGDNQSDEDAETP